MKSLIGKTNIAGALQLKKEPSEYACLAAEADSFVPEDVQNGDVLIILDEHEVKFWDADSESWV